MAADPTTLARATVSRAAPIASALRRRLGGAYVVDPWGLDDEVSGAVAAVGRLRWTIDVLGAAHVPPEGAAVLVANQRLASVSHVAGVLQLGQVCQRPVRFVGVPDLEPWATALRRLGGVLTRPDEVAGLLRSSEVVLVWCSMLLRAGARVGRVAPELLGPAVAAGAPVIPVAIHGSRFGRQLGVTVGRPLPRPRRTGPLAAVDLADEAREAVQGLLDEAAPGHWPYR